LTSRQPLAQLSRPPVRTSNWLRFEPDGKVVLVGTKGVLGYALPPTGPASFPYPRPDKRAMCTELVRRWQNARPVGNEGTPWSYGTFGRGGPVAWTEENRHRGPGFTPSLSAPMAPRPFGGIGWREGQRMRGLRGTGFVASRGLDDDIWSRRLFGARPGQPRPVRQDGKTPPFPIALPDWSSWNVENGTGGARRGKRRVPCLRLDTGGFWRSSMSQPGE